MTDLNNNRVNQLAVRDTDMRQRRVVNAAPSQDKNDYVIQAELASAITAARSELAAAVVKLNNLLILGISNLTTVGAIPKVSVLNTLDESAISDDGISTVTFAGRILLLDNNNNISIKDRLGVVRVVLLLDNANPDVLHLRNNQQGAGGTIKFESLAGGGVGASLDNTGLLDAVGGFSANGVPGETTTLTYVTGLSGVIPAGLTVTTKTVTFSTGLETSHT